MDEKKFEIEGQIENNDQFEEEFEEEFEERGPWVYIFLVIFIILFLSVASLFVYYQFYVDGKFQFSMKKRTSTNIVIDEELKKENTLLNEKVDSLENIILNMDTSSTESTFNNNVDNSASLNQDAPDLFSQEQAGEKYEVQIGAFRTYDFSKYDQNLVNMNVEVEDGFNKLVIGRFQSFDEACEFRQDLKSIGINSFIVKKVDGKRVKFNKWCNQ